MQHRSSFSQHNTFDKCKRDWFYQKVLKIQVPQDMCYAHAGNVIHKCLELFYSKEITDINQLKERFHTEWKRKYLEESKIALKKDNYWLMIVNGVQLNKKITSTELKIYYPDCVGYIDAVNTEDDILLDWKSSTRSSVNESEYKQQLLLYAWLYYRKFDRLPKKATVHYLKYTGSKGELSIVPTAMEVQVVQMWYKNILSEMEQIIESKKMPERCNQCHFFCNYKDICFKSENTLSFMIHRFGNYIQIEGAFTELLHKGIEKKFSYELKDAYFIKKNNPYANTTIKFWSRNKQQLPIGFEKGVIKTLNDYAEHKFMDINIGYKEYRIFDEAKVEMPNKFLNGIKLRDYQIEAVDEFLKNKIAGLELATGSGKSEIFIEIIRRLGYKTLVVVDKVELLRQTKQRMEDALGIKVGQYGCGEKELKPVTIATIQTIIKVLKPTQRLRQTKFTFKDNEYEIKKQEFNREYSELILYLRSVRLAVLDECHHVSSKSYLALGK